MSTEDQTLDLLAYHAFPFISAALRRRAGAIIQQWETAVRHTLPAADLLTLQQLRDSLPLILQEMTDALESPTPEATRTLVEGSKVHGKDRFHEHYNVRELIIEYRLLRRIIIEEVSDDLGRPLDCRQNVALNMAVDATLQSGVAVFTDYLLQKIQSGAETQSKYLAFLSHDLRNHLNHATLVLELLGRRLAQIPDCSDSVNDVQSIQRAIFETTSGMDRLLQAERLRSKTVQAKSEIVDLKETFSAVASRLSHEIKSKGLTLDIEVAPGATLNSDRELITLVLQNLLGNAVKYSSRGQLKMTAQCASHALDNAWVLSVSDQGPGIAPENMRQLFDAFSRGESHGQSGVGLGLSIASHAARLLNGTLEIESTPGAGSTFRLVLPQARAAEPSAPAT